MHFLCGRRAPFSFANAPSGSPPARASAAPSPSGTWPRPTSATVPPERAAPVQGAEVTASTFDILRVRPLLGRTLIPADEVIGAPTVVVIGHDIWRSRLEGDPDVVGRTIRVGGILRTVVGVMPEEFFFPFRDQLWVPLRVNVLADEED